jgi:hypothetical protein
MTELPPGHGLAQRSLGRVETRHTAVMVPCQTDRQANLMRFSSVFQLPTVQRPAAPAREAAPMEEAIAAQRLPVPQAVQQATQPAPSQELPDDLDARVRLVGEWQLGEGY